MAISPADWAAKLAELRGPRSKEWAAKQIGISPRHYSRWEDPAEDITPHWDSIEKVAGAYGLDPFGLVAEIAQEGQELNDRLARLEAKADRTLAALADLAAAVADLTGTRSLEDARTSPPRAATGTRR